MSSSKRILHGFFWSTLANLLNALYGFFSVPLLLLHFGERQYSLIGIAFSVNVYLRLMDLGLSNGNIRFFSGWIARGRLVRVGKLFQSNLVFYSVVGLFNALVLFAVSFFTPRLFADLTANEIAVLNKMLYILMFSAFLGWISSLFDQFLKANEIIGWEQRLMVFVKIFQVLVLILTLKLNWPVLTYFSITAVSSLLIIPFTIVKIKKLPYKVSFVPKYYPQVFGQIIPYGLSVFSISIFQYSANALRPVLLGVRSAVIHVNDYYIMNGFINLISILSISLAGILLPAATKAMATGNTDNKNRIAYEGTKYISIFLGLIVFGFMLIARQLIAAYVGPAYYYLLPWLYIWAATLLLTHTSGLSSLVFAENRLRPVVYMSAFSAITSLAMAWFLAPKLAVGGIIIAWLYYSVMQTGFFYVYYYPVILKLNSWQILLRSFLRPVLPLALCAAAVYFLQNSIQPQNITFALAGIAVLIKAIYVKALYTGLLFAAISLPVTYFFLLNKSDRSFIKNLLFARAKK